MSPSSSMSQTTSRRPAPINVCTLIKNNDTADDRRTQTTDQAPVVLRCAGRKTMQYRDIEVRMLTHKMTFWYVRVYKTFSRKIVAVTLPGMLGIETTSSC